MISSKNARILTGFRRDFIESRKISANSDRTLAESNRAAAETVKFHVISCRYGADLPDSPRFRLLFLKYTPAAAQNAPFACIIRPFWTFYKK